MTINTEDGVIRLRIKEFAHQKGWDLKELANRSDLNYGTLCHYARSPKIRLIDYTCLVKLARTFEVPIDDLVEIIPDR